MKNEPKIALYPGCSLETSSSHYLKSIEKVFEMMEIPYTIMQDWNCCGATSVKSIDHRLNLSLNLRNLALAEKQGIDELVVPCASCYHRLASTEYELNENKDLTNELNKETGFDYKGKVKVRNILDFLYNVIGLEKISSMVTHPLNDLVVACYYGCLNTRVPKPQVFDTMEYPMSMDRIAEALGAKVIDWSYKTECCGASLFLTVDNISEKLVGKILKDASLRKANAITVSCPMCQTNLDTKQGKIRSDNDIKEALPSPFITQLMGIAFGCKPEEVGLDKNFEALEPML
jgi:heterodisulfide reductase subunit B